MKRICEPEWIILTCRVATCRDRIIRARLLGFLRGRDRSRPYRGWVTGDVLSVMGYRRWVIGDRLPADTPWCVPTV
ncbi:MAG: hypothetical protein K2J87_06445 [Muribaculaceae bacterium]|nr:hypothetical protein [Muribaculaceae bacterium]